MTVEVAFSGASAMPFVAYGVVGVWKHLTKRPRDPKCCWMSGNAHGEIGQEEASERRVTLLTFAPAMVFPPAALEALAPLLQ